MTIKFIFFRLDTAPVCHSIKESCRELINPEDFLGSLVDLRKGIDRYDSVLFPGGIGAALLLWEAVLIIAVLVCVCVHACMCVCLCVCVKKRDRQRGERKVRRKRMGWKNNTRKHNIKSFTAKSQVMISRSQHESRSGEGCDQADHDQLVEAMKAFPATVFKANDLRLPEFIPFRTSSIRSECCCSATPHCTAAAAD